MDITCDGSWNITIEYPDGTADWCSVPNSSGQGNSRVTLQYTKNTAEEARKAVIRGISGSASASVTLTQLGTSGGGENPEPELAHWLELPAAVEQPDCRYVTHYVTVNGKSVRNYTLFFDTSERIALLGGLSSLQDVSGQCGTDERFSARSFFFGQRADE